jgi:REP element-mobilizing transposase RayT
MPDHLHWLFQLNGPDNYCGRMNSALQLSRVVKTLKGRSALAINRYLRRSRSLWQRAYYDRAARKDEDIRRIARYIIANPLRAGFERNISDYPYWDCI